MKVKRVAGMVVLLLPVVGLLLIVCIYNGWLPSLLILGIAAIFTLWLRLVLWLLDL